MIFVLLIANFHYCADAGNSKDELMYLGQCYLVDFLKMLDTYHKMKN